MLSIEKQVLTIYSTQFVLILLPVNFNTRAECDTILSAYTIYRHLE